MLTCRVPAGTLDTINAIAGREERDRSEWIRQLVREATAERGREKNAAQSAA